MDARRAGVYRDGGSSKHLDDVRATLRVSGDQVDQAVLESWVERLHLAKEWRLASAAT